MSLLHSLVSQLKPRSPQHTDRQKTIKFESFCSHFPEVSREEMQEALGKLVKQGIVCRIPRKGKDTLYCLKMPFDEALEQSKTLK